MVKKKGKGGLMRTTDNRTAGKKRGQGNHHEAKSRLTGLSKESKESLGGGGKGTGRLTTEYKGVLTGGRDDSGGGEL